MAARPVIHLAQLEQQLPSGAYRFGERHIAEGRMESWKEVDRNLWHARVRGDEVYEVEVLLQGNRLKASTCDCSAGRRKKMCSHVAALLILLHRHREQQKANRLDRVRKPPRITTSKLVDLLNLEDLSVFTREWARKHPEFDLALKARFFHRDSSATPADHLRAILEPYTDYEGGLDMEGSQARHLVLVLEQVTRQIAALNAEERHEEAYSLALTLARILRNTRTVRHRPVLLRQLLDSSMAWPDQQPLDPTHERLDFLLGMLEITLPFPPEEGWFRVLVALQSYAGFEEARQKIKEMAGRLLPLREIQSDQTEALLLVYYQNLAPGERDSHWMKDLPVQRLPPATYLHLGKALLDDADFEGAVVLVGEGLKLYPLHTGLLRLMKDIRWELRDGPACLAIAKTLILSEMQLSDVEDALGCLSPEERPDFIGKMVAELLELPFSAKRNELVGHLMVLDHDWEGLCQWVKQIQSPKLWHHFAFTLTDQSPSHLLHYTQGFLERYLEHHFGPVAAITTKGILAFISSHAKGEQLRHMEDYLGRNFSDRPYLLAELPPLPTRSLHEN
ncbi:MAG: hypothetical protein J5I41_01515 [Saprospiraceae bacterium]|nr:hypothetical protein [Saprospiraceae bacterium]